MPSGCASGVGGEDAVGVSGAASLALGVSSAMASSTVLDSSAKVGTT